MWVAPSIAIRTEPTSERGVARDQATARTPGGRPPWRSGRCSPGWSGRSPSAPPRPPAAGSSPCRWPAWLASACRARRPGTVQCVAVLSWLDQAHRSVPLRTRSDSPSWPSSASRCWSGPAYQTRIVWEPETSEEKLAAPPPPPADVEGRAGSPRSVVSTTVPDSALTCAWLTSTSSWAAVRGGSEPWALAVTAWTSGPTPTSGDRGHGGDGPAGTPGSGGSGAMSVHHGSRRCESAENL